MTETPFIPSHRG